MFTVMSACAVIDCTAGPGDAAKAAMTLKLPYVGICLSADHAAALTRHLVGWVLDAFKTEGHALYRTSFAESRKVKTTGTPKKPAGFVIAEDTAGAWDGPAKPKRKPAKKDTQKRLKEDVESGDDQPKKQKARLPPPGHFPRRAILLTPERRGVLRLSRRGVPRCG